VGGVEPMHVGDIIPNGDRGAQIVLDPDVIKWVVAKLQSVGDVEVRTFPLASLADLRVRAGSTKELTSVESSMRLDAVASAGMKLSRSKLAKMVKEGSVEVNFVKETNRCGRTQSNRYPRFPPPRTCRMLTALLLRLRSSPRVNPQLVTRDPALYVLKTALTGPTDTHSHRKLVEGDVVAVRGKGRVTIEEIHVTAKQRFRVRMTRAT